MADGETLTFSLGEYAAVIPTDRRYSKIHMWLKELPSQPGSYRVGLTAYSVRLLRDVYFLDWQVDPGSQVRYKQEIGEVESSKAVSSLYSPAAGVLGEFNPGVLKDPSAINADTYNEGWLFTLASDSETLSPQEYLDLLAAHWPEAQRQIKGQITRGG